MNILRVVPQSPYSRILNLQTQKLTGIIHVHMPSFLEKGAMVHLRFFRHGRRCSNYTNPLKDSRASGMEKCKVPTPQELPRRFCERGRGWRAQEPTMSGAPEAAAESPATPPLLDLKRWRVVPVRSPFHCPLPRDPW